MGSKHCKHANVVVITEITEINMNTNTKQFANVYCQKCKDIYYAERFLNTRTRIFHQNWIICDN